MTNMKTFLKNALLITSIGFASLSVVAQEDKALNLDALLKQLEQGQFEQYKQNVQREKEFEVCAYLNFCTFAYILRTL